KEAVAPACCIVTVGPQGTSGGPIAPPGDLPPWLPELCELKAHPTPPIPTSSAAATSPALDTRVRPTTRGTSCTSCPTRRDTARCAAPCPRWTAPARPPGRWCPSRRG